MEVESYPKWKETKIGDTPIFHWTMIMGGRVNQKVFCVNHRKTFHTSCLLQFYSCLFKLETHDIFTSYLLRQFFTLSTWRKLGSTIRITSLFPIHKRCIWGSNITCWYMLILIFDNIDTSFIITLTSCPGHPCTREGRAGRHMHPCSHGHSYPLDCWPEQSLNRDGHGLIRSWSMMVITTSSCISRGVGVGKGRIT